MRWGGVLFAVGLMVAGVVLRQASLEAHPQLGPTIGLAAERAAPGFSLGRLVAAATGTCDDFNECTVGDAMRGSDCAGVPIADGTGCASDCGTCWNGECVANPELEGAPCADGFGSRTVADACQSLSGIAVCLGRFEAFAIPSEL